AHPPRPPQWKKKPKKNAKKKKIKKKKNKRQLIKYFKKIDIKPNGLLKSYFFLIKNLPGCIVYFCVL
ncbi:hypothetical protein, partial [Enterobacter hormaechei]